MISQHIYSMEVLGNGARPKILDGNVTLDELNIPYAQASLKIALPAPEVLDALDPRAGGRVRLTLTQRFGRSERISTLSQDITGTLADYSAAFENLTGLTNTYGIPYNDFGMRPSTSRRFNLSVRSVTTNYVEGTVDIDLASDEALLDDMSLVATAPLAPNGISARAAVTMVLESIGATLTAGPDDGTLEADSVYWTPGQTAWDYVKPLVDAVGLRLYCDERRRWHLVQPLAPTEGMLNLSDLNSYVLDDYVSREADWYDAVVVAYKWKDSSNVDRVRYDVASQPGYSRVYAVEYDRPWPGDGAAAALLKRVSARGRVDTVTSISNYDAMPGQALSIGLPNENVQTGLVANVEWSLSTDQMTVRSRDLIDTPPNAWALLPTGVAWQDIPVGVDWQDLEIEGTE